MCPFVRRGFTLVEILIVVVILGILAAIVIPVFTRSTNEARMQTTYNELQKIRRHLEVFRARNAGALPAIEADVGTWGEIVGEEYLMEAPTNAWVGGANSRRIEFGEGPDTEYQTDYGWIFDAGTATIWAGGFDSEDKPIPRPE